MPPVSDVDPPVPKTVLIVEDHDDLRQFFGHTLRIAGFDVSEAADGHQALRMVEHRRPDVIVLDIRLPTIDGYSLREEIAAHPETRDIPVVVVTASDVDRLRVQPACVLRKPVTMAELVAAVRSCFATKGGTRLDIDTNDP